jgi:import receptor subunit TOM20
MELTNLDVSNDPSLAEGKNGPLSDGEDELSPSRGPPSEASSQEWDKVTDPGSQTPAL